MNPTPHMLDYFADAAAQGCCDTEIKDTAFWLVTDSDRYEFPMLTAFGVALGPDGLQLYATRDEYVAAVALAALTIN
jgi:hypothetical protein